MFRLITVLSLITLVFGLPSISAADDAPSQRAAAKKAFDAGNYKDAYETYSKLSLDPADDPSAVSDDFLTAVGSLNSLGRTDEIDDFREKAITTHAGDWRFLQKAAYSYYSETHYGYIVAGKFYRGNHRGGDGKYVDSFERDRTRALQLMQTAVPKVLGDDNTADKAEFYFYYASLLIADRNGPTSWRLQYLTDLSKLPDYDEGYRYSYGGETRGAPVDEQGNPIFHQIPASYAQAKTDGERWRWCLHKAAELSPAMAARARWELATFLRNQFDVQTMASYGYGGFFGRNADENTDEDKADTGPFAVRTLGEDETIARLATGFKRFKLPDSDNFIRIFQGIADDKQGGYAEQALNMLAGIFQDRQQYNKAATYWQESIDRYGDNAQYPVKHDSLAQIVGNWATFEPVTSQPAGLGATVDLRFRNARSVSFQAYRIDVPRLLHDVKAYLTAGPAKLDWDRVRVDDLGYRLVQKNQNEYVGDMAASWDLGLEPRPNHFDKRITVQTPLKKPGAYLLKAKMANGNTSQIILWVADTVIVKKPVADGSYCFVADALTGKPIPGANIDFFGYNQTWVKDQTYVVDTSESTLQTDGDGQATLQPDPKTRNYSWLVTATTPSGRLAYLGFSAAWYGYNGAYNFGGYDDQDTTPKTFLITDRPVYRPGNTVKFKLWIGRTRYDQNDQSSYAGKAVPVVIRNPKGDKVLERTFMTDQYGGLDGEFPLDADATLGQYQITGLDYGGGSFRVEEYKKPEFEVTVDAPSEPVMLGDKITGTIRAKYYFGAPVTNATVKYKVLRSSYSADWYPEERWDWLYQPGYWWFASDYEWYPGWHNWGIARPVRWWWGRSYAQPEVVMENEAPIGPDGTLKVTIDTALAKLVHGDTDHRYEITAEVTDASRRTIVGTGSVMAARQPFKVYAWVDRGYYRTGDTVQADFTAQTLDNKPVHGKGNLKLLKVTYGEDGKPVETPVQQWTIPTDADGKAHQQIRAASPGQYRLSYTVTDSKGRSIEGGYLFPVRGEGTDDRGFRFNDIELVTDKKQYKPGDQVRLMVNTDRPGSTVALFVRPSNGIYLPPKILHLTGKSQVETIDVAQRDMPNFFVEGLTVSKGQVFTESREIIVPPEDRVIKVQAIPSAEKYKPGEKAKIAIKLTGPDGKPFVGSTVVSLYDKSLDYISGGSNVPDIKTVFWSWKRSYQPQTETNVGQYSGNIAVPNEKTLQSIGVFGDLTADLPGNMSLRKFALQGESHGTIGLIGGVVGAFSRAGSVYSVDMNSAAPGAPAAAMRADRDGMEQDAAGERASGAAAPPPNVEPTVRSNFADTALWVADLTTDKNGVANVDLTMPENLTTWKARVWTMGGGSRVGEGDAEVITSKNLLVRLQAPRFFVQKDEVTLSCNVHNYLKTRKHVLVGMRLDGSSLEPLADSPTTRSVWMEPNSEMRADFRVHVQSPGEAVVRVYAKTDEESDAMQMKFPVYIHGMLKTESFSGSLRPDGTSAQLKVRVPADRLPAQSRLEVRYSPSLASSMVDALPYLVDYPYGTTDETLTRFVPTVITEKILLDMKLDLKAIQQKRTNLNAQQTGDDITRAADWKRDNPTDNDGKERNPVFDTAEVAKMVAAGVTKLNAMQLTDGGWGWFSGYGEQSYPDTTALVVHGLQVARDNGAAVDAASLDRGVAWLKNYQARQVALLLAWNDGKNPTDPCKAKADNVDAYVYMVLADAGTDDAAMRGYLYRDRNSLSVYGKAMFGLAMDKLGHTEERDMILHNLNQYVVQDNENQTAYLKLPDDNAWWNWYGSDTETNAYYLKLLARTDPKGPLASRLAKYIINNRQHATYWNSTRDTATCIEALADYVRASGESQPDMTVQVLVDGKKDKEVTINAANLFTYDNKLTLTGDAVTTGDHTIELRKTGTGPLYFNAYLTNFTLEDPIQKAGLEIKVSRKFYKLTPANKTIKVAGSRGQALDQMVEKYDRQELTDLSTVKSGDLVEVELEIDSKNDYEYILFEDMKAAGFEAVDTRSGYNGNDLGAYMELRDNRVAFFARTLARGKHSVSYRLRAEVPGQFNALPTRVSAMYAPELKANSDEMKLNITD